jgi:hypothetical protein
VTRLCPEGCPVRWETDTPCPLCGAPGEGLPEDAKPTRGRVARAPGATVRRYRVTMTDEEHEALKRAAVEQGCAVADLIRRIAPVSPRAHQ